MAIYAIGDLQGCYDPLQRLLERRLRLRVGRAGAPARPQPLQSPTVARQRAIDRAPAVRQRCLRGGFDRFHRSLR